MCLNNFSFSNTNWHVGLVVKTPNPTRAKAGDGEDEREGEREMLGSIPNRIKRYICMYVYIFIFLGFQLDWGLVWPCISHRSPMAWVQRVMDRRSPFCLALYTHSLPDGRFVKSIEKGIPSDHTCLLCSGKSKSQAGLSCHLRTEICRLNSFLSNIQATDSAECGYNTGEETVHHFLLLSTVGPSPTPHEAVSR